jgi:hypothetical protein
MISKAKSSNTFYGEPRSFGNIGMGKYGVLGLGILDPAIVRF